MLSLALAGKPNAGKSTFYAAATMADVQMANYPFTTIDANRGVTHVRTRCPCTSREERCGNQNCRAGKRYVPVELLDVAGLVPGAHEGRGLGNQFLDELANADAILNVVENNTEAVRSGNVDVHPSFLAVARQLLAETVDVAEAAIDEPVTTDTHRLIRLPGSLHGGSGLAVTPIEREDVDAFDPLTDAVPETFVGHDIAVDVAREYELGFRGETVRVTPGVMSVPEYAGVFLMARGWAEKARES
mgnify:CR=1 FL=1